MSELKNIWNLAKTGFADKKERSKKELVFFLIKMFLILVFFKISTFGIAYFLESLDIFEIPANLNRGRFRNSSDFEVLFLIAVYAPIVEELTFRLPLKFSKWNLIISAMGLNLAILKIFGEIEYLYCFIISAAIGITLYLFLKQNTIELFQKFWTNNKLIVFYFFLLIFSFLHLKNYELTAEVLLFSPVIILPRILGAMVYSYIRLSSGILLAICFHAFNNGIFKIITIISDYTNGIFSLPV
ncbi:hypothetical protein [Aquimarina addita]|uniref:hypothetical protein n=1 Tax=Aquimarina addita TaxID=870485 RepID=UPI0031E8F982